MQAGTLSHAARKSLDASGGGVYRNLLYPAEAALMPRRRVNSDVRRQTEFCDEEEI